MSLLRPRKTNTWPENGCCSSTVWIIFDWERDKQGAPKDPEKTILQPKNNLECGVRILEKQILEQHKPLLSQTNYWALRPGTMSYHSDETVA